MVQKKNIKIKISKSLTDNNNSQIVNLIKQTNNYQRIIQDTILNIQNYKSLGIIQKVDLYINVQKLEELFIKCSDIKEYLDNSVKNIDLGGVEKKFDEIKNELSNIFKSVGCVILKI